MTLNEDVALVQGWTYNVERDEWNTPDGKYYFTLPDYEHDIAAAIELMFILANEQNAKPIEIPWTGGKLAVCGAICRAFLATREEKSDE